MTSRARWRRLRMVPWLLVQILGSLLFLYSGRENLFFWWVALSPLVLTILASTCWYYFDPPEDIKSILARYSQGD